MHTIHKKEFTLDDFSHDGMTIFGRVALADMIKSLNNQREDYLKFGDKRIWRDLIIMLPESYNQKRTVTLNYETLRNIYSARRNHKLDEWSVGFMEWIDSLPYAEELIKYQ